MRRKYGPQSFRIYLFLCCSLLSLSLVLILAPQLKASEHLDLLDAVRERIEQTGSYTFQAEVAQTLVPRALPEMIGKTSEHAAMFVDGQTVLPDKRMVTISSTEDAG